jgi:hypothetical protein
VVTTTQDAGKARWKGVSAKERKELMRQAAREETRAKGLAFKAFEGSKAAIPYVDQTAR